MKKILITGAKGFFASRFIECFKNRYDIVALAHNDLNIIDENKTIEMVKTIRPDLVVHAAAISDTGVCERNHQLSYNVNVEGTTNIAKACANIDAKLIFLSSDQIYNGNNGGPYNEKIEPEPNTIYGNHKMEAENSVLSIVNEACILRLTWLFSLPEREKKTNSNIVWNIVKAAMKNEAIILPQNEYRGITHVYDILDVFPKIINLPKGIYNTGSENEMSTYETGEAILDEMGLGARIQELLIKDTERYRDKRRDLRIYNKKLADYDINFPNTAEAIKNCIMSWNYKL